MSDYTIKQIALMKKKFLNSDFGKYAAEEINRIYGDHHSSAENAERAELQASFVNKAAGVHDVIRFFTDDVALLDAGILDDKKEDSAQV